MANRVSFVVDGFNLYHSLREVSYGDERKGIAPIPCRWLDLRSLCESSLHLIGNGAALEGVYYFSALAKHLDATKPGLLRRHTDYADALRSTGVVTEFANFLAKEYQCPSCKASFTRHEEKRTDVAIGAKILELAITGTAETIVCVSGDSDMIPALRTARRLFPAVKLWIAFPFGRGGNQLKKATHDSFTFSSVQYARHQFPETMRLPDRPIYKPLKW